MRKTKLLAMLLMSGMILNIFTGCASGISTQTIEQTTTTTTVAQTSTPTPTPEPTSTPTPTPVFEKLATDEKLIGTSWFTIKNRVIGTYTFKEDNTGFVVTMIPVVDGQTNEESIRTTVTEFQYSIIDEGMIRIYISENRISDYEYEFVGEDLQLISLDPNVTSDRTTIYTRNAPW